MSSPANAIALLCWGLGLLAFTLVVWCYRVAKSLSFMIAYGEWSPNVVIEYFRSGQSLLLLVVLCLPLSVAAAFLLRMAEASGAVAWRAHPRIPFQMVAWALAGLFLTEIVLTGILWLRAIYLWVGSTS